MVIKGFADKETAKVFSGQQFRKLPVEVQRTTLRKLLMLDATPSLSTLRVPPSNHLEALKHDRAGQHSIRINKQWRICFVWKDGNAYEVEITDYH